MIILVVLILLIFLGIHCLTKIQVMDSFTEREKPSVYDWANDLINKKKNYVKEKNYICFNDPDIIEEEKCSIWDKPCLRNEDCPFFQKNRNYSNKRGGCRDGFCEMPVNVIRKGFRLFETHEFSPFCYNCTDKNQYDCCQEQYDTLNSTLLLSPDYMFINDFFERQNQETELASRNLFVS